MYSYINQKKNCISGSNNIYTDFPALMSSGGFPVISSAYQNNKRVKQKNNIHDNYDYRQFLTQNADSLILENQKKACDRCCGCLTNFQPRDNHNKYLFTSCNDATKPFGYESSDLKNLYLNKMDFQSRLSAPFMTQSEMLKFPRHN